MDGEEKFSEKTIFRSKIAETAIQEESLSMSTMHLSRKSLAAEISVIQKAFLEVYGIEDKPIGFELDKDEVTIGRKSECSICLPLFGVSRIHARIIFRNEEYYLEDLNSTNGSYVNTIRVVKCVLRNHDQIQIGEAKLIFIEEKTRRNQLK